jgi:hypothetical protein
MMTLEVIQKIRKTVFTAISLTLLGLIVSGCGSTEENRDDTSSSQSTLQNSSENWVFEENFNSLMPDSPSQALLPETFGYAVTHRAHSTAVDGTSDNGTFGSKGDVPQGYIADYGNNCEPYPETHVVRTTHRNIPDEAFYICNERLMSSMGDVSGFSVASFWPKQEFNFFTGGTLEFEVDFYDYQGRHGWEIVIMPRNQIQFMAVEDYYPVAEKYPDDAIILSLDRNKTRQVTAKNRQIGDPITLRSGGSWNKDYPDDPAFESPDTLRKMIINFEREKIEWCIVNPSGNCDTAVFEFDQGLPITKGLVFFNTIASEPLKDGNQDSYTYQWDSIKFSGIEEEPYESFSAQGVVALESNGNRPIGDEQVINLDIPEVGMNPVLVGQVHNGKFGQVLLTVNNNEPIVVAPHTESSEDDACAFPGWRTFFVPIDASYLREGTNTLKWQVSEPDCNNTYVWDGFSIKQMEIQFSPESPGTPSILKYKPLDSGDGLIGVYSNGTSPGNNRVFERIDPNLDFWWSWAPPQESQDSESRKTNDDQFSVRWKGFVQPEHSEEYTIYITSDDGARMWIDGEQVIDDWEDRAMGETISEASVQLEAGKKHEIVVEYYENDEVAGIKMEWESASQNREIVPQSALYSRN